MWLSVRLSRWLTGMDTSASPQLDDSLNDSLTDGEEDHSEGSPSPQVHTHTHTPCYKEGGVTTSLRCLWTVCGLLSDSIRTCRCRWQKQSLPVWLSSLCLTVKCCRSKGSSRPLRPLSYRVSRWEHAISKYHYQPARYCSPLVFKSLQIPSQVFQVTSLGASLKSIKTTPSGVSSPCRDPQKLKSCSGHCSSLSSHICQCEFAVRYQVNVIKWSLKSFLQSVKTSLKSSWSVNVLWTKGENSAAQCCRSSDVRVSVLVNQDLGAMCKSYSGAVHAV